MVCKCSHKMDYFKLILVAISLWTFIDISEAGVTRYNVVDKAGKRTKATLDTSLNTNYTGLGVHDLNLNVGNGNGRPLGLTLHNSAPAQTYQLNPNHELGLGIGLTQSRPQIFSPNTNNHAQPPLQMLQSPNFSPPHQLSSGGWGAVNLTPETVSVPVLALETSLAMDSTGAMSSSHQEYLHLLGDHQNQAMAQAVYGSDAYHGLLGTSSQTTQGNGEAVQNSMGFLEGGTNQLYNIAIIGQENQAIVTGFSDAIGTGSVTQQSTSEIISPTMINEV